MKKTRITPLQILIHIGAWFPLARLIVQAITDDLTANPIQYIEQRTGLAAITLLFLSLAATPLHILFRWKEPLRRRRTLGLYAFMYATIHVVIFADLDYGLAWSTILETVLQKPYILVGALAFLLLIPLAITSFDIWKIRLRKNWKRLHRLVYIIAPLVVLHYAWGKKGTFFALQGDILLPLIYGSILLILMILRIPGIRRCLASARMRTLFTTKRIPKERAAGSLEQPAQDKQESHDDKRDAHDGANHRQADNNPHQHQNQSQDHSHQTSR